MMLDHIELPDDLLWVDEFDWNPVAQDIGHSLTGALMVQEQAKLFGRPITLTGGDEAGWVTRATVLDLMALAEQPTTPVMLILADDRMFPVAFDRREGSPILARALINNAYQELNDFYSITIKLIKLKSVTP